VFNLLPFVEQTFTKCLLSKAIIVGVSTVLFQRKI
jgi:hypothetical protein